MKLFKRIKFALRYDIAPEFIVVPLGEFYNPVRFLKYEDALAFVEKYQKENIDQTRLRIFVSVEQS